MFDLDDLSEDSFILLCVRANPEEGIESNTLYIWKGPDFEEGELTVKEFIQQTIDSYWSEEK